MLARAAQTLIGQDIVFSIHQQENEKVGAHMESWPFACADQERRLAATLPTKSGAVVCDAHFKQKNYLPVICMCKIHNLLLKTQFFLGTET